VARRAPERTDSSLRAFPIRVDLIINIGELRFLLAEEVADRLTEVLEKTVLMGERGLSERPEVQRHYELHTRVRQRFRADPIQEAKRPMEDPVRRQFSIGHR
jgi:hypothetical protein